MPVLKTEIEEIRAETDMVRVRNSVRTLANQLKFSLVEQTKLVTAASEIARNTLIYGKGGTLRAEVLEEDSRKGLKLVFEDHGPGIPDIELAMTDGYTSGGGLGLGLSGARRLVSEFAIESSVGSGTRITLLKWK
jgi:serine/threonine-protein kinase RsbT